MSSPGLTERPPAPAELQQWAQQYRHFADHECSEDSLYVVICRAVADSPELLALMQQAPPGQRRPNLLLAALQERLLSGVQHPLAAYYPSVGGVRTPDGELPAQLLDFARAEQANLLRLLATRSTQTNEIGRCAVLWPALGEIARRSGRQDLALFDFGSSAGLNLGVDDYRYDYDGRQRGATAVEGQPLIRCEWRGAAPLPPDGDWRLTQRLGVDPAPVDPQDAAAVRWLQACLWPQDRERAQRLDLALALARRAGRRVRRAEDCLAEVEPWLDGLPTGVQPVLFNSWVLAYFDAEALAALRRELERLVRGRGLIWLSAETPALRPPELAQPPSPAGAAGQGCTLWTLQEAESGRLRSMALAWSHPHGRWVEWLAA